MEISPLRFQFALTRDDLRSIREAIHQWGKPAECVDGFTGVELYRHFEGWEQFVETDWADWDQSEYNHDIGCRFWIQVAIEHASPATRAVLEQQVVSLDAIFIAQMRPVRCSNISECAPLSQHPYFWETHTIHPEL
jgi:hypothetical protein